MAWLREIGDYLAERDVRAAAAVTEGIYERSQVLVDHPKFGYRMIEIAEREVRVLLYGHYRIVYDLREFDAVYILAVFHSGLDIDRFNF